MKKLQLKYNNLVNRIPDKNVYVKYEEFYNTMKPQSKTKVLQAKSRLNITEIESDRMDIVKSEFNKLIQNDQNKSNKNKLTYLNPKMDTKPKLSKITKASLSKSQFNNSKDIDSMLNNELNRIRKLSIQTDNRRVVTSNLNDQNSKKMSRYDNTHSNSMQNSKYKSLIDFHKKSLMTHQSTISGNMFNSIDMDTKYSVDLVDVKSKSKNDDELIFNLTNVEGVEMKQDSVDDLALVKNSQDRSKSPNHFNSPSRTASHKSFKVKVENIKKKTKRPKSVQVKRLDKQSNLEELDKKIMSKVIFSEQESNVFQVHKKLPRKKSAPTFPKSLMINQIKEANVKPQLEISLESPQKSIVSNDSLVVIKNNPSPHASPNPFVYVNDPHVTMNNTINRDTSVIQDEMDNFKYEHQHFDKLKDIQRLEWSNAESIHQRSPNYLDHKSGMSDSLRPKKSQATLILEQMEYNHEEIKPNVIELKKLSTNLSNKQSKDHLIPNFDKCSVPKSAVVVSKPKPQRPNTAKLDPSRLASKQSKLSKPFESEQELSLNINIDAVDDKKKMNIMSIDFSQQSADSSMRTSQSQFRFREAISKGNKERKSNQSIVNNNDKSDNKEEFKFRNRGRKKPPVDNVMGTSFQSKKLRDQSINTEIMSFKNMGEKSFSNKTIDSLLLNKQEENEKIIINMN